MNARPLDELEMFDVLQAAYPEKFSGEDDATWEAVQLFADEISGWHQIADLLGRITMLTMPMDSQSYHCLGKVEKNNGYYIMSSAVRREVV